MAWWLYNVFAAEKGGLLFHQSRTAADGKAARRKPRPELAGAYQGGRCAREAPPHSCPDGTCNSSQAISVRVCEHP